MDLGMDDPAADPMADPAADPAGEEDPLVAVMDSLPMGQAAGTDVVEIDLGAIMSAAKAEGAEDEKAKEELADEVGIPELADEEQHSHQSSLMKLELRLEIEMKTLRSMRKN